MSSTEGGYSGGCRKNQRDMLPNTRGKELFFELPRKNSLSATAWGGNLNAYNVLMQGGIAKADDYAKSIFMSGIIDHI